MTPEEFRIQIQEIQPVNFVKKINLSELKTTRDSLNEGGREWQLEFAIDYGSMIFVIETMQTTIDSIERVVNDSASVNRDPEKVIGTVRLMLQMFRAWQERFMETGDAA